MSQPENQEVKERFVVVGDEIGYAEQYLGDSSTTYIENGKIYAAIAGNLTVDKKNRVIHINGKYGEKRKIPEPGDLVTGTVYSIRRSSVGIKISTVNDTVVVDVGLVGNIHVSNVAKSYIDKLDDVFEKTDFIRAKVIKQDGNEFQIMTIGENLGVIKSTCKYCGHEMVRKSRNQVVCPFCNNYQRKELANDYGDLKVILSF